jgi:thiol-disulfide isomerase/thioredoxin
MKRIIAAIALLACSLPAIAQDYTNHTINIGQQAPEIEEPNPQGETLKLSDLTKDRIVFLDFWASWCPPCRHASPEMVALYNKYKDAKFPSAKKGFTIVSVSLDQKKEPWLAAIAQDGLVWPYHLSDLGGWRSQAAATYGVQSIPQAFLIGPDGKVIGKYGYGQHPDEDLEKLVQKKGKSHR